MNLEITPNPSGWASWFICPIQQGACWICGSTDKLSREHKIKKALLKKRFGEQSFRVSGNGNQRIAQSLNSDRLKFSKSICSHCNGSLTQESDQAFDIFCDEVAREKYEFFDPEMLLNDFRFRKGSTLRVPLFRYMTKLLGCQMIDNLTPIPLRMKQFILKKTEIAPTNLSLRKLPKAALVDELGDSALEHVSHGGLVIYSQRKDFFPEAFVTSLNIQGIQIAVSIKLHFLERFALKFHHPDYVNCCKLSAIEEARRPRPLEEWQRVGLG